MTAKLDIVERLGEHAVLLPGLIAKGLAANDRLKLRLSLLQEAAMQARAPSIAPRRFEEERRSAGLEDPVFDRLVADAREIEPGRLHLPGVTALLAGVSDDLGAMLEPLTAGGSGSADDLAGRLTRLTADLPETGDDMLTPGAIEALAAASRDGRDTVHLLVMDLHKALNRLAAETAAEELDGARVHGLDDMGRAAVRAFMRGLNRTKPLAFGHPGLDTTAVKAGARLTIQNDIGTTDAHVLVVHVDTDSVTVTYTDIHRQRAKFFMSLFEGRSVTWSPMAEQRGDGLSEDVFYLMTGRHGATDALDRDAFLEFLGSRIVFLIDWNKARKALQAFVGRAVAIDLLTFAAREDFGHRAFLELGGGSLIHEAVHRIAAGRIPYGVRLDSALGEEVCAEFLRNVLRDTSQGLAAGRTSRLIRDEVQADLSRRFETAEGAVLTVLVRHLGLTRMLAASIADVVASPGLGTPSERRDLALRGKRLEEKADRLTVTAREVASRLREVDELRPVIDQIEDATDCLEDGAFLIGLVPEDLAATLATPAMARLADIVTDSCGQMVRAVEAATRLPQGQRADALAALQAIDAVAMAERAADVAERECYASLVAAPSGDARGLLLGRDIARALESATDQLLHAALALRDRVLEELSA